MAAIRFRIHLGDIPIDPVYLFIDNDDGSNETDLEDSDDPGVGQTSSNGSSPQMDGLFSILTMLRTYRVHDIAVEEVMRQSMEDGGLHRKEEIELNISEQRYDTTEQNFDDCTVCREAFDKPDTLVTVLPCGHIFHPNCLREWGRYNPVCPVCKRSISIL